jgi:hypothetical protein
MNRELHNVCADLDITEEKLRRQHMMKYKHALPDSTFHNTFQGNSFC